MLFIKSHRVLMFLFLTLVITQLQNISPITGGKNYSPLTTFWYSTYKFEAILHLFVLDNIVQL